MLDGDVFEAEGFDCFRSDEEFFANSVDEVEVHVGVNDGEWNSGEATTGAEVEDSGTGIEVAPKTCYD